MDQPWNGPITCWPHYECQASLPSLQMSGLTMNARSLALTETQNIAELSNILNSPKAGVCVCVCVCVCAHRVVSLVEEDRKTGCIRG